MTCLAPLMNIKHTRPYLTAFNIYKVIYQRFFLKKPQSKKILFIVGCQRSGTTVMTRVFNRDVKAKVYMEHSVLSSKDALRLRLDPVDSLKEVFSRENASFIVLKPLVELQNISTLLHQIPESHALYLFRHYKDVASSNLKRFGMHNGINDLRPIVLEDPNNWRSENVSAQTRAVVDRYFSETMNPYDAAALFWYARNQLFFEQNLDTNDKMTVLKYEDFVNSSDNIMKSIYSRLGLLYPSNRIAQEVHPQSVRKGSAIILSPEIEYLCSKMLNKLDILYTKKWRHLM
jgi:hypothetical protein